MLKRLRFEYFVHLPTRIGRGGGFGLVSFCEGGDFVNFSQFLTRIDPEVKHTSDQMTQDFTSGLTKIIHHPAHQPVLENLSTVALP